MRACRVREARDPAGEVRRPHRRATKLADRLVLQPRPRSPDTRALRLRGRCARRSLTPSPSPPPKARQRTPSSLRSKNQSGSEKRSIGELGLHRLQAARHGIGHGALLPRRTMFLGLSRHREVGRDAGDKGAVMSKDERHRLSRRRFLGAVGASAGAVAVDSASVVGGSRGSAALRPRIVGRQHRPFRADFPVAGVREADVEGGSSAARAGRPGGLLDAADRWRPGPRR